MLSNTIFATAVLVSAPLAHAIGSAIVVNACEYQVKLCNVPSADGGFTEIDEYLQPNDTYTQSWTELTNGNGWSIKLSPNESLDSILQYEYTFHNDGIIWYDLSEVNGNPWDSNWEITADSDCSPKQQAYRYATDDAYGMQSCPADSTITVTLCSGEDQNDGAAASASSAASTSVTQTPSSTPESSYAVSTTSAPSSTPESSVVPTTTSVSLAQASSASSSTEYTSSTEDASSTSTSSRRHHWWTQAKAVAQPTTLATVVATSTNNAGAVVTNVVTEVETVYATATAYAKREAHHAHQHAHPHYRA